MKTESEIRAEFSRLMRNGDTVRAGILGWALSPAPSAPASPTGEEEAYHLAREVLNNREEGERSIASALAQARAKALEEAIRLYGEGAGPETWDYFSAYKHALIKLKGGYDD